MCGGLALVDSEVGIYGPTCLHTEGHRIQNDFSMSFFFFLPPQGLPEGNRAGAPAVLIV